MQKAVLALQQQFTLSKSFPLEREWFRLLLAFGSNLGQREQHLNQALTGLSRFCQILQTSSWKKTKPLIDCRYETSDHGFYLNFVSEVVTPLSPYQFYQNVIVPLEDEIGHNRLAKWSPRCLDIDVVFAAKNDALLYQDCTPISVVNGDFIVPHQEYGHREFWKQMIEKELKYDPARQPS